jgi:gluconolactonase
MILYCPTASPSPDESVLYINDSRRGHIRAFDLLPNGTLAKQTDRVFVDLQGEWPGVPMA